MVYSLYHVFHKYGGANVAVKNSMSQFVMFVLTKTTVKLANENTGWAQVIGIVLFCFPNYSIINPLGPVYYCPGHPSNTMPSYAVKCYVGFQKVKYDPIEHCDFVNPQYLCSRLHY